MARRMRTRLLAGLGAIAAAGCAHAPDSAADRIGRLYTYVRSNSDGSEAETIHVYRASRTRIEVTKMRSRCTNAAFVTAELDLVAGQATRLTGGRLEPDGGHRDFAILTHDRRERRIRARVEAPGGILQLSSPVPDEPWHLYDFDLASLTVTAQYRADPRRDFSFGLPLVWLGGDPADALRYLGRADARFAGEEDHGGRRALRFEVGGPAFGGRGGPIWFDAAEGHVLAARFGIPNHAEYRDFALRLTGVRDAGPDQWRRLLSAHFEGCPADEAPAGSR
ncbi:MAG TPA: hypothetical protein VN231_02715 [Allosphingosinicella sp.]|nr:hypothetical protein [Allosphingosinicella sp.]